MCRMEWTAPVSLKQLDSPGGAPAAAVTGRQVQLAAHAAVHLHMGLLAADSAVAPRSACTQTYAQSGSWQTPTDVHAHSQLLQQPPASVLSVPCRFRFG